MTAFALDGIGEGRIHFGLAFDALMYSEKTPIWLLG